MRIKKWISTALIGTLAVTLTGQAIAEDGEPAPTTTEKNRQKPDTDDVTSPANESWAIHGQLTNVTQWYSTIRSPYSGTNSLPANGRAEETTDLTFFAGLRLWRGTELWLNPEIDQGFGIGKTLGIAGFPSGEAYKVGANTPYLRLPRIFLRQVISLGGETHSVEAGANQLAGSTTANNLTVTLGKFSVVDIFDTNSYAHDPRSDFMNWATIDAGTFDYAADSWGFTYGAAAEWTQNAWTLRGGLFQLSPVPNGKITAVDFTQYSAVAEVELRQQWSGRPGKIKLLGFADHGRMGSYQDALQLATNTSSIPDVALVRRKKTRTGISINVEQELAENLGLFIKAGVNDGSQEAYEFTEINKSLSTGLSLKGQRWGRPNDTFGASATINAISSDAQAYFNAGGLGLLIGDGRLNYGQEKLSEFYYASRLNNFLTLSLDYQHVVNPGYNRDRGPVSIYGVRVHAEF